MTRKTMIFACALAAVAAALTGCGGASSASAPASSMAAATSAAAGLPNPMSEYGDVAAAQAAMGYAAAVPTELPDGYSQASVFTIDGDLLEINFEDGEGHVLCFRSAKSGDDISGDYNTYAYEAELELAGRSVAVKGEGENEIRLATWMEEDVRYALMFDVAFAESELEAVMRGMR